MDTKPIPLALARRLYVTGLFPPALKGLPVGKEGVAQVIDYLGYVQIDTIHIIQRAHHHTLWARRPDYSPDMLHELQAVDRRVFEYWGHAASILPMSDYRFYLPSMRAYRNPRSPWVRERLDNSKHLFDPILDRIRTEGPLATGDFEHTSDEKRGSWWDWKPAKSALELLFWRGDLMISQRRNFTRVYDLTERVLPPHVDTTVPDPAELGRFLVRRALSSFSIAPEREISDHIHGGSAYVPDALQEMVSEGEVVQLQIEGLSGSPVYALPQRVAAADCSDVAGEVHILSPFDNATIHRRWVKRLFGFDYTIECYVPEPKRKYGYFCLPVLWGDRFVARMDCASLRKEGVFAVKSLIFEPDFIDFADFLPVLAQKLRAFAAFHKCPVVRIDRTVPGKVRAKARQWANNE